MTHPVLVEAAIDTIADAERAVVEGADRLEVCARLDQGGLTPDIGLVRSCLALGVRCVAMARPRAGSFVYGDNELRLLIADVDRLLAAGVHGIVFGALVGNGFIDERSVRQVVRRCDGRDTVFHRAFDECGDPDGALDVLIRTGVTRVLTSGHAPDAGAGVSTLARLVKQAAGRLEILAGGGVRAPNVNDIVTRSGVMQVHARAAEAGTIAGIVAALSE